jgi:hypothetical protein
MIAKPHIAAVFLDILRQPTGGVPRLVNELLEACNAYALDLDCEGMRWRARAAKGEWEDIPDVPLRKSVFRAVLARIAALCNEAVPNSVSPYGGESDLTVAGEPAARFRVVFVNTAEVQRLELTTLTSPPREAPLRAPIRQTSS